MLKFEKKTWKNREGDTFEYLDGTYEDRNLGGPFLDFKMFEREEFFDVKLGRSYSEDASWANKMRVQLVIGLLSELCREFPGFSMSVSTDIGVVEIPADSDGYEIQEVILDFVIRNVNL